MIKKIFSYVLLSAMALLFSNLSLNAQNVIITDDDSFSAHSSAMLHVKSLNKGFLIPKLTETQRDGITTPAEGLLIYQTNNTPGIYIYQAGWKLLGSDLGTHTATQNLMLNNNWLSNDGDDEGIIITDDGKVGIDTLSPEAKLHVVSEDNDIAIFESKSHGLVHIKSKDSSKVAALYGSLGNDAVGAIDFRPLTGDLTLWTNDFGGSSWHQRMMIKNSSGYVGIGTDAPTSQLTIQTSGSGYNVFSGLHIKELTDRGTLTLESVTNDPTDFVMKNNNRYSWSISSRDSTNDYSLNFYAAPEGTTYSTMAMSMATDGKIGIGLTDPFYSLDVNGEITSRSYNAFRLRQSTYSAILRNDKNNFYFLITDLEDPDGSWNDFRPFTIDLSSGRVELAKTIYINHEGNTGIGTTTPSALLDVNKLYANSSNENLIGLNVNIAESSMSAYHTVTGLKIETNPGGTGWSSESEEIGLHIKVRDLGDVSAIFETGKVGIGTTEPTAKLSIKADAATGDTLFAVKDQDGNNVFVVYPDAVQVIVPTDTKGGTRHKRGAFVVSGRGTSKGSETNFMDMTKENSIMGYEAAPNVTGTRNSIVGFNAGYSLTSGDNNVIIGDSAGYTTTTGELNVLIGNGAGYSNSDGGANCYVGNYAGYNSNGSANSFYGNGSGINSTGMLNSYFGYICGANNVSGTFNAFYGSRAGENSTGSYNTFAGTASGYNSTSSNSVFIGYQAGFNETNSNRLYIDNSSTTTPLLWGDFANNKLVINGNSSHNSNNRTFYSNGSAGGSSAWNNDSDKRLKTEIQTIQNSLEKVLSLRGVNYKWKDGREKGTRMGFIAQEANEVIPEVVTEGEIYSMQYAPVTALLVEAIKEQQQQIEAKDKENKDLKEAIQELNKKIEDIELLIKKINRK